MEFTNKKVLFLVENLSVPFDKRVWLEALALKKMGVKVFIVSPKGKEPGSDSNFEVIDGIEIYRYNCLIEANRCCEYLLEYSMALICQFYLACKIFLKHRFNVIHVSNPPDLMFLIGLVFKAFGVKFIFDQHDLCPELYQAKTGKKGIFYKILLLFEKFSFKTANIVISANESYKDIAMRNNRGGVLPRDVFVVRNAPQTEILQQVVEQKMTYKKSAEYAIGYVGVMGKQDSLNYLLNAARHLIYEKNMKNVEFILIGTGTEYSNIKNLAAQLGLGDFVIFTGMLPQIEAFRYLSACDVCVTPDEVNEYNAKSSKVKIFEYMALGKPIVQFDMDENRYMAQGAALYAKPNDYIDFAEKIYFLLNNDEIRGRMGNFGKNRIQEHFQWKFSEKELFKAYQQVFEPNS